MPQTRPPLGSLAPLYEVLVAPSPELATLGDAIARALVGPLGVTATVNIYDDTRDRVELIGAAAADPAWVGTLRGFLDHVAPERRRAYHQRVVRTGEPATIDLSGVYGDEAPDFLAGEARHNLIVALRDGERSLGTLQIGRARPHDAAETADMVAAGGACGRAVANALLVRQLRRTERITRAMAGNVGLEQLFTAVLTQLREVLEVDVVRMMLLDESGTKLTPGTSIGAPFDEDVAVPVGEGYTGAVVADQRPLILEDVAAFPVYAPALHLAGLASVAGVPITHGRRLGMLFVGSVTPRRFWAQDIELLELVADRAGLALRQSRAERALRRTEAVAATLLENAADGILSIDAEGIVHSANPSVERMFGYSSRELVGQSVTRILDDGGPAVVASPVGRRESTGVRADASRFPVELAVSEVRVPDGAQLFTVIVRDATEQRATEDQLRRQALHDGLTGLPNRALFSEHLEHAMARYAREGRQIGVMFLDLDRFKHVNDSLGHAAGDELLCQAAARLARAVRPTDVLSRLGGDEFAVLLEGVMPRDAITVARRILRRFERPFELGERQVQTTTSIGIAHSLGDDLTAGELLRHADAALYLAKGEGRGRFEVFDESMRAWLHQRLETENELRRALDTGQIVVHYQPLLDLRTGEIDSVEALVRWRHPQRGLLTASEFIGVAEESGLIVAIGLQVVREAADQLTRWQHELGERAPSIAVNLSARELAGPVDPLLEAAQDKMSWLGIELSETTLMADAEREAGHRRELERHGARIIVDDFGMGYSSLSRLSRMRVDMIKVAKEFVDGVCTVPRDRAAVDAVIRLAHALGIAVVAEGVETEAQLETLRELHCDLAQGNLIASAQPADQVRLTRTGA